MPQVEVVVVVVCASEG